MKKKIFVSANCVLAVLMNIPEIKHKLQFKQIFRVKAHEISNVSVQYFCIKHEVNHDLKCIIGSFSALFYAKYRVFTHARIFVFLLKSLVKIIRNFRVNHKKNDYVEENCVNYRKKLV